MTNRSENASSTQVMAPGVLPVLTVQGLSNSWISSVILAVIVFLSRIGFLSSGYGTDPDAHRLAVAAYRIRQTGHYVMSREPGHPVQEALSSLVCPWGPIGLNALTALMSSLGVLFFSLVLRRLKVGCPLVVAAALGFSPLYFVHSVDAMDYVWALAFSWAGSYFALRGWAVVAGVALGLAVGCRVTEALSYFPMLLLLGTGAEGIRSKRRWLHLGLTSVAVAAFAYLPVFSRYGWSALRVYDGERSSPGGVWSRLFVEPWGWPGLAALCSVSVLVIVRASLPNRFAPRLTVRPPRRVLGAAAIAIVSTSAVFLRLPHDSGYLLPVVPWVLFLASMGGPNWQVWLLSVAVTLGSVSLPGLWKSPVLADHEARQSQVASVSDLIASLRGLKAQSVLVAGTYQPKILSALGGESLQHVEVRYLLNQTQAEQLRLQGTKLFYLRRALSLNRRTVHFDLRQVGATPL